MLYWWVLYRWHSAPVWTFFLFLWVTIPAILVYLSSVILFPGELESTGSPTWRDYYYKNRRGFFFIFGSIAPLDIVDTLLRGRQHFIDQGALYLPFIAIRDFGCLTAGLTRNQTYHAIWAILFPVVLIFYTTVVLVGLVSIAPRALITGVGLLLPLLDWAGQPGSEASPRIRTHPATPRLI